MPNRTICSVLEEMRKCFETYNFAPMLGLIEEAQSMGNRMESAIYDINDIKRYSEERSRLRKEVAELRKEKKELDPEAKEDDSIAWLR